MLSRQAVFTRLVGSCIAPAKVVVQPDVRCDRVVELMREADASAAVVCDQFGRPLGILTEQDLSRRIAFKVAAETPVGEVMTAPLQTVKDTDYLHHAIAWMERGDIRHLPVVSNGTVVGLLELDQVLAGTTEQVLHQFANLEHDHTPAGIRLAKQQQPTIARQLLDDQVPAVEIQQLLSRLNHQLTDDVIELCLEQMKRDGLGGAPVPFEVIVMGSGGRGESYLRPDQDNGIIIADYADREHTRIDPWFIEFSERMNRTLDEVGFDYCRGNVMARNPMWRKTGDQWQQQIGGWIRKGNGNFLRLCDIFFDFAPVYGNHELALALRVFVTDNASQLYFLREMYRVDEQHDVALGPFGWLQRDRLKGPNRGKLNLKITGTLPLVGAVRILALWQRVSATSTLQRIEQLYAKGALSYDEQDELSAAYQHIVFLLLRQQLSDAEAGIEPANHVAPEILSKREKELLISSFKAIRRFRSRLRTDLTGDIF